MAGALSLYRCTNTVVSSSKGDYLGDQPQADISSSSPGEVRVRHFPANTGQDHCQNGIEEARSRHLCADGDATLVRHAKGKKSTGQCCWDVDEGSRHVIAEPDQLLPCIISPLYEDTFVGLLLGSAPLRAIETEHSSIAESKSDQTIMQLPAEESLILSVSLRGTCLAG